MTKPGDGALSEAVAKQILARAAQLDATERMGVSVVELRTAAAEAGISAGAIDRALNEITSAQHTPVTPARSPKSKRRLIALAAAVVVIGFWVVVFTSRLVVEEPVIEEVRPIPEVTPPR